MPRQQTLCVFLWHTELLRCSRAVFAWKELRPILLQARRSLRKDGQESLGTHREPTLHAFQLLLLGSSVDVKEGVVSRCLGVVDVVTFGVVLFAFVEVSGFVSVGGSGFVACVAE